MNALQTDSLIIDSKREPCTFSPSRKASIISNKSNLSYISNSIFEAAEPAHGYSISESIDRRSMNQTKANENYAQHCDELEPLVQDSEFENIIASFERELSSIKNSTCSLQRQLSAISRASDSQAKDSFEKSSSTNTYEEILPMRQQTNRNNNDNNNSNDNCNSLADNSNIDTATSNNYLVNGNSNSRMHTENATTRTNSVKLKRRSLEKQMKIDDGFNVCQEIRKICDHMQAPFSEIHVKHGNSADGSGHSSSDGRNINPDTNLRQSCSLNGMSSGKSPATMRRKNDFHSSLDRIKRASVIERVDESVWESDMTQATTATIGTTAAGSVFNAQLSELQPMLPQSERFPRKTLNADMNIESLSLKSTGSYEHLVCHTDNKEAIRKIRFQKNSEENDSSVTDKDVKNVNNDESNANAPNQGNH